MSVIDLSDSASTFTNCSVDPQGPARPRAGPARAQLRAILPLALYIVFVREMGFIPTDGYRPSLNTRFAPKRSPQPGLRSGARDRNHRPARARPAPCAGGNAQARQTLTRKSWANSSVIHRRRVRCKEGRTGRPIMAPAHFKGSDNLTLIIEPQPAPSRARAFDETNDLAPLATETSRPFWMGTVKEIDGHDHAEIMPARVARGRGPGKPKWHSWRTTQTRAKAFSFMSDNVAGGHHKVPSERAVPIRAIGGNSWRRKAMNASICGDSVNSNRLPRMPFRPRPSRRMGEINRDILCGLQRFGRLVETRGVPRKQVPDRLVNVGIVRADMVGRGRRASRTGEDPLRLRGLALPNGAGSSEQIKAARYAYSEITLSSSASVPAWGLLASSARRTTR